jgi:hypothetical protein
VARLQLYNRCRAGRDGADAVEQFGASDERHAQAGNRKQPAAIAGILLKIVGAPLDRSDGDRIGDKIGLEARLDDKQSADLAKLRHC